MPYSVDTFSGSKTFVVEDGTIDTSLDIRLIGKNYAGYGEVQNENFVHLLENFANVNPPPRPINGQIWFDNNSKKIKYWDASSIKWRSTGGVETGTTEPVGASVGDLWWNTDIEELSGYNGSEWVVIGPTVLPGYGITRFYPRQVTDILSQTHPILVALVDDVALFVISKDAEFTLSLESKNEIAGQLALFGIIKPGITLSNTDNTNGITTGTTLSTGTIFWGSVSHSITSANLTGGQPGSLPYQSAANITGLLPPNITTTRKILSQLGNGTAANYPEWIILPTVLPISKNDGTILNVPLANGTFPVTTRNGSTVNITVN